MTKICFCAIFRNEGKNVYRCLNAAKPIIDYISICDTGSTDNTIELIKKWGEENNIPTTVHHEEFKNFGHNRTLSFELAKKSYPESDYAILIDADMVLKVNDGWKEELDMLDNESYLMIQRTNIIQYWNTRFVSIKEDWKCIGVTHEYWDLSNKEKKFGKIRKIWIDDKNDGGHKADKFERDKKLLLDGLKDPDTPDFLIGRYMFYLAQTYRDMGNNKESIKWYKKRIENGGWDEELFYSQFQIGVLYERLKDYDLATASYLQAWNMRPIRAEPLYSLAKMYRFQGKNMLAYTFASIGKNIKLPIDDLLFVEHTVYLYKLDEEISICAYYVGKKNDGAKSCKRILSLKDQIHQSSYELALSNIKFYQ